MVLIIRFMSLFISFSKGVLRFAVINGLYVGQGMGLVKVGLQCGLFR